jgi:uncharacterized protein YhdP
MLTQASGWKKIGYQRWKWALAAFVAALVLGWLAVFLVFRLWLWPSLPGWQDRILVRVNEGLAPQGLQLETGPWATDWRGLVWPRLTIQTLRLTDGENRLVLSADQLQARLGTHSLAMLWRWQPIFSEIRISSPRLTAGRDQEGTFHVAGVPLAAGTKTKDAHSDATKDSAALTWLLRQGRLRIDGGLLSWTDDQRRQTADITEITFALNNLWLKHAWALRAEAPESLGSSFAIQGNFRHALLESPADINGWVGQAFVQFDRVDLERLFSLIGLPEAAPLRVASGQGAFRAWLALRQSALEDLTVDLDLVDARVSWGQSRTPLALDVLKGRLETRLSARNQWIQLSGLELVSKQLAQPLKMSRASIDLKYAPNLSDYQARFETSSMDLGSMMILTNYVPVPASIKKQFTDYAPKGVIDDLKVQWRVSDEVAAGFNVETRFTDLSLAAGKERPGFSALSGLLRAREDGGEILLNSQAASLIFPGVFEQPLRFDALTLEANWTAKHLVRSDRTDGKVQQPDVQVRIRKLSASNRDLAVEASGGHRWAGLGAGEISLQGRILRAAPDRIYHYVPLQVGQNTRQWLRESLRPSKPYSGKFELAGPLNQFPFKTPEDGIFKVQAQTDAGVLRPASGWPDIRNIDSTIVFDRTRFALEARPGARFNDVSLTEIVAKIDDLNAWEPLLHVRGAGYADFQQLIQSVHRSPVRGMIGGITSEMKGRGPAQVNLDLLFNLSELKKSEIAGSVSLARGALTFNPSLPEITALNGQASFNQNGLLDIGLRGQMLGAAMQLSSRKPSASVMLMSVAGRATGSGLEGWLRQSLGLSYAQRLTGLTSYEAEIEMGQDTEVRVASSLVGLSSDLPAPFQKSGGDRWDLVVRMSQAAALSPGIPGPERWVITTNQPQANARIVRSSPSAAMRRMDIDAPMIAGVLTRAVDPPSANSMKKSPPAAVVARFQRLWLSASEPDDSDALTPVAEGLAQDWPAIDAVVEDFRIGARNWGRLELQAAPAAASRSWEISKFSLSNDQAVLSGQGRWAMLTGTTRRAGPRSRTSFDLQLEVKDGGGLLGLAGYSGLVKGASGSITGNLNWPGSPVQFSGGLLSGNVKLSFRDGQFLKTEPGIGRLISVVNLQSLPRRIKLDFRDVFSEGFTFERVRGDLQFANGLATTQNLRILGVQASVMLEGSANLQDETQDLRVLVLPEFNAGLASLGYAALVNPAIGLGTFIAQFILRNPVREFLSYEYKVTGTWQDPKVETVKRELKIDGPELKAGD